MMKNKPFCSARRFLAFACLSTALIAGSAVTSLAEAALNFRVYSSLPGDDSSAHYIWYSRFQENLNKNEKLKGQIKLNYFPNGMLGKEADATQQVRIGAINMMISGTSIWATLVPEVGVLDLGYLFKDYDHVGKTLDGKAGEQLSALMMSKANVMVLGYGYNLGARNVYTKKAIEKPEDLKNLKIRVLPVPNFIATLNHMGAVAIPMPGGEVYSSLQMGVIDGVEHDAPTIYASKYYEIIKNGTLTRHSYNPLMIAINKRSFEQIPQELRADVLAAAKEATEYERQQASMKEAEAIKALEAKGVTFRETDRAYFAQAVQPVWKAFLDRFPDLKPMVDEIGAIAPDNQP
ncbi:C4-dicarboxylate ABC transporter substrate-binding protein [Citrobacter amalonaticus]|uniref:C4-dicarboxylate ABC transporter substrate-binding protein n=1 Tax=Citrobacter amalonaticus TaxID=35703 RepID=A0A2S4RY48_CITAM|nr:TRAP transporter substrate-binding protein [Citrobacter amalonaticus]POT57822.1 C4-dicarboxylate ABC transporter substrate-binding protein [Citrobacter amalonaticus]POT76651.1 C4-dicarboxylate ABC transporter substrate-binding protein [Citrobacter amalonaticus]POU65730.1 C4-dicarboxylate ABC transporter substrate-binding protein [Citrobacter amalonaticus]POV05887.1 C4-dicarboxylate ABC transporter substrate-binding protein [Citrobacter amalonaticus]